MSKVYIVSANHVSEKYRLDKVRFAVDSHAETGRVGFRDAANGYNVEYWASLPNFGCGATRNTAEKAIRDLLLANGCTGILIEEEIPVEPEAPNRFERLQREFPDFDVATLPEIPAGFEDVSWHNDNCPSFYNEADGLILFVDYADASQREFPETKRFSLNLVNTTVCVIDSDDWQSVLNAIVDVLHPVSTDIDSVIRLAREFGSLIQQDLGRAEFRQVIERNKNEDDSSICHTHDFCDANMLMSQAFQTVFERPFDGNYDPHIKVWNDAWQVAKAADFFA